MRIKNILASAIIVAAFAVSATALIACGDGTTHSSGTLSVVSHNIEICEDYTKINGYAADEPKVEADGDVFYYAQIAMQFCGTAESTTVNTQSLRLSSGGITYDCVDFIKIKRNIEYTDERDEAYDAIKTETVMSLAPYELGSTSKMREWKGVYAAFELNDSFVGKTDYTIEYNDGTSWKQIIISNAATIMSQEGALVDARGEEEGGLYMAVDWNVEKGVPCKICSVQTNKTTTHYKKVDEKTVENTYNALRLTIRNTGDQVAIKASDIVMIADGTEYKGKAFLSKSIEITSVGSSSAPYSKTTVSYSRKDATSVYIEEEVIVWFDVSSIHDGYSVKIL